VQTEFTVKLMKFDETKKVALIKEVKALIEGMNLVQVLKFYSSMYKDRCYNFHLLFQAKKFVESAPTIVKADISKEEADKLAGALIAVGATCEVQ
jgi:large subunit ribosomal protein L7/L12